MRRSLDLFYAAALMVLAVALLALPQQLAWLRFPVGLAAVLLVPGYAMGLAIFARRADVTVGERLALTLGLSVASVVIVGLLLNYTPLGLTPWSMGGGLLVWTLVMIGLVLLRRSRLGSEAYYPSIEVRPGPVMLVGAAVAASVGLALALRPSERQTEFYLLGPAGNMDAYPARLSPGEAFSVTVGVNNLEGRPMSYQVRLPADLSNTPIEVAALNSGQSWRRALRLRAPEVQGRLRLPLELYRQGDTRAYRTVYLVLELAPPGLPQPERALPPEVRQP